MTLRPDLAAIAEMIEPNSRVLDVGCGDGALLEHLKQTRNVDGRGIELSQQNVNQCVARGLSVLQGDADTDLADYPSQAFDVVILSQTIQATRAPAKVLEDLLRIGRRTIRDFTGMANQSGAQIEKALALSANGTRPIRADSLGPNLMAEGAIFLMNRRGGAAWGPIAGRAGSS